MKDGERAFACASVDGYQAGMTLRDYFAGQAMQGLVANGNIPVSKNRVAKEAYSYADSMLAERERNDAENSD